VKPPPFERDGGNRGAKRKLRHRGKIPISHELSARPVAANDRIRRGGWEAYTIVGFTRKSGLLTLVDRKSRFLLAAPLSRLGSKEVKTITPERGFAYGSG